MSNNARNNFKKPRALVESLMAREERILLSGRARSRVTGAGKHLRFMYPDQLRKWAYEDIKKAIRDIGLPENMLWFSRKDQSVSVNDMRRLAGWIRACTYHQPARTVLKALYRLNNGKGMGSPSHRADYHTLPWLMRLWKSPNLITAAQAKGLRWLAKAPEHYIWEDKMSRIERVIGRVDNVKLFERVAKLTPLARWALCGNLPSVGKLTHRDLNWERLAGMNRAQMLEMVPTVIRTRVAWKDLGINMPRGITIPPKGLAIKTFRSIMTWEAETYKVQAAAYGVEHYEAVIRLTMLFGRDSEGCIRYLQSYMKVYSLDVSGNRLLAVHDASQKLPSRKIHPGWKTFVVTNFASQHFGSVMDNLDLVEEICGGVPKSVGEARVKFLQAGVPWDFDLNFAEKSFVRVNESKNFEMCPHVEISEGEYTLRKLDSTDTRQLTAGRLTDCCQHLNGAGAACARLAWTSGICAIYAAFKGERMVAQTFAWRAMDGSLVFDSIEALRDVNRTAVLPLFSQCADAVLGRLGVIRVLVGVTNYGITSEFYDLYAESKTVRTPDCMTHLGYSDARAGCKVVCKAKQGGEPVVIFEYPEGAVHQTAVNQLMQGSDVFCEHCGAEVHPACEICPNCELDISEWVD